MPAEKCGNLEIISHSATTFGTIIFFLDFRSKNASKSPPFYLHRKAK